MRRKKDLPGQGEETGQVPATNSGAERRERYRRPRHPDQQIECRGQQNVTASSHRQGTRELSPAARSFVVLVTRGEPQGSSMRCVMSRPH